jgi:hypothetical protein
MKGLNVFKWLFILLTPIIIASFLLWQFQEKRPIRIFLLDKTVIDHNYTEHKSFNWVLNNCRYTKTNKKPYSYQKDYYGFFPLNKNREKSYEIKSLRLYEVLSIGDDLDMLYYIDSYGISYEDWYNKPPDKLHSNLIYGGVNQNDYLLLSEMKRKNRLILTEFNLLGAPTSDLIRNKIENLFDFKWTGWTGCYYKSLSIANPNLPGWIIKLYEQKSNNKWNYSGQGIIFFNLEGDIVVLQNNEHLNYPTPQILTGSYGQSQYHLPEVQNYSFWFDVIEPGVSNKVVSSYNLQLTENGKNLLLQNGIPITFPAIIEHLDNYKFYYFAGDFSDRNLNYLTSYFKGMPEFARIFTLKNSNSKNAFFWRFYQPLIENILKNNIKL